MPTGLPWTLCARSRALPATLAGLALAGVAACAPDAALAPRAAPTDGGPSRYVARTELTDYTQVAAGHDHSCAVTRAGGVRCWGANTYGQTVVPADLGPVTQLTAGYYHNCAITAAGAVRCWGTNTYGQTAVPADLGPVTQISAGLYHTCAVTTAGAARCWGNERPPVNYGQALVPLDLASRGAVKLIRAGGTYTCAVSTAGFVRCWGTGFWGATPAPRDLGTVTQLSVGGTHNCVVTTAGPVRCWGANDGNRADFGQSVVPGYLRPGAVVQVSAGGQHTCALTTVGGVLCWGGNPYGPYGLGAAGLPPVPADLGPVTQLATGSSHNCAVTTAGNVRCWGNNASGQSAPPVSVTRVLPTAQFVTSTSAVIGQPFSLQLRNATVPGYAGASTFTYAFDCGDGRGYAAATATATVSCAPATVLGTRAVRGKVIDRDGDSAEYSATVRVVRATNL